VLYLTLATKGKKYKKSRAEEMGMGRPGFIPGFVSVACAPGRELDQLCFDPWGG
jgi:hypothetical protein